MHDLMHDLALEVAGKESLALETSVFQSDQKIRHLSIGGNGNKLLSSPGSCLGEMKKLRSLKHNFDLTVNASNVNMICSNLRRLRVLDFKGVGLTSLPNTLGNLSHLRYLDLSNNYELEILPESITKLQNLLVLNLANSGVTELPKGLRNLHNLRHLVLTYCFKLTHMPVGIGSMVDLQTLSLFVMAGKTSKKVEAGQLKDLRSLVHLKGRLEILFRRGFSWNMTNPTEVDCLLGDKVHLNKLVIRWEEDASNVYDQEATHEILLQGLRPHGNIKGIQIGGYKRVEIPSWVGSLAVYFRCLVEVSLHDFDRLVNLPLISQLLHLKVLRLSCLPEVEFIECDDEDASSDSTSTASDGLSFFPSLEELELRNLPKFKEVGNGVILRKLAAELSFSRLHKLVLEDCPCLTHFPRCPGLKSMLLIQIHEDFRVGSIDDESPSDSAYYLKDLCTDNVRLVNLVFGESLKGIESLSINGISRETLPEAADLFQRNASSLRSLSVYNCKELNTVFGGGIEHLTNLTYLNLGNSNDLFLEAEDDYEKCLWKSLKNLIQLDLWSLSSLICLPQGIRHLTSLMTLRITDCNLESLPEWLPCLTSLSYLRLQTCNELKSLPEAIRHMPSLGALRVWDCKHLTDRCRETDGLDWPKISLIDILDIRPNI